MVNKMFMTFKDKRQDQRHKITISHKVLVLILIMYINIYNLGKENVTMTNFECNCGSLRLIHKLYRSNRKQI